jgi:quinol monooxygenase YgiN
VTDQRLALIVEFLPARGRAAELREALLGVVGPTRAEDGCLLYDLHEDVEDPEVLAFYEIWETPSHHAAHDATPHIIELVTRLPELTAEPPRVRRLRRIEPLT